MNIKGIGKAIVESPVLFFDCEGTATLAERPTVKSTVKYVGNVIAGRSKHSLSEAKEYASEHIRYILGNGDIGIIKPAVSKILLRNEKRERIEHIDREFLKNYEAPYFRDILDLYQNVGNGNKSVAVVSRRLGGKPVIEHFGLKNAYSLTNGIKYDKYNRFVGFDWRIKKKEDKVREASKLAEKLKVPIEKCFFVGNGCIDSALARICTSLAAPFSEEEMIKAADYNVDGRNGYKFVVDDIVRTFQEEMPKVLQTYQFS